MIKLDLRHSKIGDTAFKCLRVDAEDIEGMTAHSVFKRVFKALIRETYFNGVVTSVNEAAKLADAEIEEIGVEADFVLWFIDKYVNVEEFRSYVTACFKASYDNGSLALGEFMDLFKEELASRWGKIANTEYEFSVRERYILALLNSMFSYLFICKENYYSRLSSSRVTRGVKNDLFIIESRGYYWQTCGERVDGMGSKLKVPNLKDIVPKNVYDVGDKGYGSVNCCEVISNFSSGVLMKVAVLKDLSKVAYKEFTDNALCDDTLYILEDGMTFFEILYAYLNKCMKSELIDGQPVLISFLIE